MCIRDRPTRRVVSPAARTPSVAESLALSAAETASSLLAWACLPAFSAVPPAALPAEAVVLRADEAVLRAAVVVRPLLWVEFLASLSSVMGSSLPCVM